MKTIGLLGGMSWESTREYYRLLNEGVRAARGGLHSAPLLMHSFDFAEIASLQHAGQWQLLGDTLAHAAKHLQDGGADAILICTNLMHKLAPAVESRIAVPLLHITDATGEAMAKDGIRKVALLGAIYTMREDFYRVRIQERYGIEVITPPEDDMEAVSRIIYDELCQGTLNDASRQTYYEVIERLKKRGAEGIIMGCTEIPLLLSADDSPLPLYDTTWLHTEAALAFMLQDAGQREAV